MRNLCLIILFGLLMMLRSVNAQVVISESPIAVADSSALFEIKSTDKGFLPPRMTKIQRDSIVNPANGLIIYCSDCKELQIFQDSVWTDMIGEISPEPFTCGDSLLYEGRFYQTVQIGSQCWFAENLNVGTMVTSTSNQLNNSILEKKCYQNDSLNCVIYGGFYTVAEMLRYKFSDPKQGICPTGWHIPSDKEFMDLEAQLGMAGAFPLTTIGYRGTDQGSQLAGNASLWLNSSLVSNPAFGASGFNAVPGGYANGVSHSGVSADAYFWTSSYEFGSGEYFRQIRYVSPTISRDIISNINFFAFNVRCVQD